MLKLYRKNRGIILFEVCIAMALVTSFGCFLLVAEQQQLKAMRSLNLQWRAQNLVNNLVAAFEMQTSGVSKKQLINHFKTELMQFLPHATGSVVHNSVHLCRVKVRWYFIRSFHISLLSYC